jgi:hypothetical protein
MLLFDRLYLTALLLGIVGGVLNWQATSAFLANNPAIEALGTGLVYGIVVGSVVVGLGINLLLWYFISRRASNAARWIWVVLLVVGLPGTVRTVSGATGMVLPLAGRGILIINVLLQLAAAAMLFRPDARAWFASGGQLADRDAFD